MSTDALIELNERWKGRGLAHAVQAEDGTWKALCPQCGATETDGETIAGALNEALAHVRSCGGATMKEQ